MGKSAIILGATGLVGKNLLEQLLKEDDYTKIISLSRRKVGIQHKKLEERVVNLLELEIYKKDFIADVVFCCIGTTAKKTPNKKLYKSIDYGIPVQAAKLSKENNVPVFIVISAVGANPESTVFYNRTKGEMEQAVMAQKIKQTYILQPSIILGNRNEFRLGEKIGILLMRLVSPLMIANFKKYKPIPAKNIANAMLILAQGKSNLTKIESDKITELALQKVI